MGGVLQVKREDMIPLKYEYKDILTLTLYGVFISFIFCAILVYIYRFPVPMFGYTHGLNQIPTALLGLCFYHIMGLFVLILLTVCFIIKIGNIFIKKNLIIFIIYLLIASLHF